jgi:hypothetical protein
VIRKFHQKLKGCAGNLKGEIKRKKSELAQNFKFFEILMEEWLLSNDELDFFSQTKKNILIFLSERDLLAIRSKVQ